MPLFQNAYSRTLPDIGYGYFQNSAGAGVSAGWPVYRYPSTAGNLAISTAGAGTDGCRAFVGIAESAIASGDWGLVKVYGYVAANVMGHASLTIGSPLVPTLGQNYLSYDAGTATAVGLPIVGYSAEVYTTTSAASKKVFLRLNA